MLQPYMPQTVNTIGKQLNVDISTFLLNNFVTVFLQPGHKIGKVLFNSLMFITWNTNLFLFKT